MTFHDAARRQYLHASIYTVWLVGPDGSRRQVGTTQRKSGVALRAILRTEAVQAMLGEIPGMGSATYRKYADRLEFTNGWRVEFGGTIRQEAE